jgi:hypothetical protein
VSNEVKGDGVAETVVGVAIRARLLVVSGVGSDGSRDRL